MTVSSNRISQTYNIAMISDFFYPNVGGVEGHIYELSQCLLKLGHKIIVITHSYSSDDKYNRQGVRYFENKLKVFYLPFKAFYNQCAFPTLFCSLPLMREIFIREKIEIVHAHSAFSSLALESILHARTLNLHTVFTDHSLFGFSDLSSVLMNKLLQYTIIDTDCTICVSHTSKENTVLRSRTDPNQVFVIPNAVHADAFRPFEDASLLNTDFITVVVISRLVYRKGMDLLCGIIPPLCSKYPQLRFIIAGDGSKRVDLEEIKENYELESRVELVGAIKNHEVSHILNQGQIFLSPSLTEAFCIAIVEAASCGLQVVATDVGGVSEVLPSSIMHLCKPTISSVSHCLSRLIDTIAIEMEQHGSKYKQFYGARAMQQHTYVFNFYNWSDVAIRTQKVYGNALKRNVPGVKTRLQDHRRTSTVGGLIFAIIIFLEILLHKLLRLLKPDKSIRYLGSVHNHE